MVKAACAILLSVGLFWPVAAWLGSASLPADEDARIKELFAQPQYCLPEPGERAAYLVGMALLPLLLFGFAYASRRWEVRPRGKVLAAVLLAVEWTLAGLLVAGCLCAFHGDRYFHFRLNHAFIRPVRTLPILVVGFAALWGNWQRRFSVKLAAFLVGVGVLGVIFVASLFGDHGGYAATHHFNAVFDSVVQVQLGKALLIDGLNQYGFYPHLLQPFFALAGLTVLKFTVLMGLLTALAFGLVGFVLSRTLTNPLIALMGFLATVFNSWMCFLGGRVGVSSTDLDVYFQYQPIRLFFPACALGLAWWYLLRRGRGLYWTALVFLAAGIVWNLDAGVPAFGAWVAVVCFAEIGAHGWPSGLCKSARHLLAAGLALAAVVVLLSVTMRLVYGAFPNYGLALYYQRLFYVAGFCMLPMHVPGAWMVVILIYLAGLAHAAFALASGHSTVKTQMSFFLSVLGVGLFAYFQGRSHPGVLTLAWWPCFPLLALFLDELVVCWVRHEVRRPLAAVAALVLLWFLAGSTWSLFAESNFLWLPIRHQLAQAARDGSPVDEEASLLKKATPPGGRALVVSQRSALYHLHAGVPSLAPCGLCQLLLVEDHVALCRALDRAPQTPIFVEDISASDPVLSPLANSGMKLVTDMLRTKYQVVARTATGCLYERALPPGTLAHGSQPVPSRIIPIKAPVALMNLFLSSGPAPTQGENP